MTSPASALVVLEDSILVAAKEQVSADLGGEAVILKLDSGVYYALDEVGAHIWSLIQEPISMKEIRDAVLERYEVEPDRCERDIVALCEQLFDAGLIEIRDEGSA